LRGSEFAPCAGVEPETVKSQSADGHADEAQGRLPDRGGHAADLAVLAFGEGQFDPGVRYAFPVADRWVTGWEIRLRVGDARLAGQGAMPLQIDAAGGEPGEGCHRRDAFDL